jgi:hypothetical protein
LLSPVGANLEYEYALMAAYAMLLAVPLAGLVMPRAILPVDGSGAFQPRVAFDVLWVLLATPLFGLLPGVSMFLYGACPCSKTGYLFWMGVLWFPTSVLAHALLAGVMRARVQAAKRSAILVTLAVVYAASALSVGISLWVHPQKRIVDFFAGFLHGPIYDDWIAFDLGLMLARSAHLALALGLILLASITRRTRITMIATAFVFTTAVGLGIASERFYSVKNRKKDLDELMYGSLPGDGFTLRYRPAPAKAKADPQTGETNETEAAEAGVPLKIQRLHRDAQFHVNELRKILGATSTQDGRPLPHVEIYVYPSDDKKKLWFGGGATDVTDVFTPTVHISGDAWPHPTLRHELVHALTSGMAYHGLGFHPNMAFTEGLAVALAPTGTTLSLDDGAASVIQSGRVPDVEALFSPMFWKVSGGRAYTVAGSFIKFLVETKGIDGVLALYAGDDWEDAFKQGRDALVKEWKDKILAAYDKDKNALYAEALFRHPGLFADDCPHSKADLSRNRAESAYVRMRQPIGWDPDSDYLAWLIQLDPKDKEARLRLWRREIRKVATDRWISEGRLTTWREAVSAARAVPPATLEDVELALLESDLVRLLGDPNESLKILRDLADKSKSKYFGESLTRETEARLALEEQLGPGQAIEWRKYLAGWRRNLPDAGSAGPWILSYLRLRNEKGGKIESEELTKLIDQAPDAALSRSFHLEWYRIIAQRLMREGRFQDAAKAYRKAADAGLSGNRDVFAEHARRALFYAELGPLRAALPAASQSSL